MMLPRVTGKRLRKNMLPKSSAASASLAAPEAETKASFAAAKMPAEMKYMLAMLCSKPQVAKSQIGKNTAISGVTVKEDYPGGMLESGETLIKAGERV